eukprot:TRINITY_DN6412_c0_g1_i2.p1 TRINITY_DN6412_c0_g1~~TRINITY_DN6412_c0_g1_i2.p1  ORF type:complete len:145 (+),score=42.63 TRINITY_DN6412_c0_g1_i2:66-500(+)
MDVQEEEDPVSKLFGSVNVNEGIEILETNSSTLKSHQFSEIYLEHPIHFLVLELKESFYVWIGDTSLANNLSLAMKTNYSSEPSTSNIILGSIKSDFETQMAQHLAKRFGKPFFVSSGLATQDPIFQSFAEARVFREMKEKIMV